MLNVSNERPVPHFKAQIGYRRVKLGVVRVLTVYVAFYSDFSESDETPIICFEPHLTREIGATLLAFCEVSILFSCLTVERSFLSGLLRLFVFVGS